MSQQTAPAPGRMARFARRIATPQLILLGVFLVLCLAFTLVDNQAFASIANWRNILLDVSVLTILAVGATLILAMGDFDVSIGAVLVFSGVISAQVMNALGDGVGSVLIGFALGLIAGGVCGAISGLFVARFKIPSIIVTLGMLGVAQGAALVITNGVDVRSVPRGLVMTVGNGNVIGTLPWLAVIAGVVAVITGLVLHFTVFGRNTIAMGSNAEALRRAGTNIIAHKIQVFALAGALYGLAGFLSLARFSTTTLAGHGGDMLDAYTAAILGGNSPFGGTGSIFGSVIGVFIPVILRNGFVIAEVQPFWQQIVVGVILIVAVFLHRARRKN